MEVFEHLDGRGFTQPMDEILTKLEDKTTIGEDNNNSPLVIVMISDGSKDRNGKRIVDTYAAFDTSDIHSAIDGIQEVMDAR